MKTNVVIIIVAISVLLIIGITAFILFSKTDKVLFEATYYFGLGSRRVKIYRNGEVYDDLELENPNHVENYQLVKILTKDELKNLKNNLNSDYVIQLVYGVKEFDDIGGY